MLERLREDRPGLTRQLTMSPSTLTTDGQQEIRAQPRDDQIALHRTAAFEVGPLLEIGERMLIHARVKMLAPKSTVNVSPVSTVTADP